MKHMKPFAVLLALLLVLSMAVTAFAQDEETEEGTDIVLCGLIAFVGDDIVITVDADGDGLVSDEEFADGQEVTVAPSGSFNPSDYEDGDEITPESLMELADNKYKNLKLNQKWNTPSPEEEKIIALEAQIAAMKRKQVKFKPGTGKSATGSKGGDKKPNGKRKARDDLPSWMDKKPSDDAIKKP